MILARPVEFFYVHEIRKIVEACIILHNMMVEVRISSRDQEENGEYYQILPESHRRNNGQAEADAC